ncbi:MAG: ATP synthase F1 subunit delta [Caldilineae bacterium]|nr:MAG: ATP synthase F1 subunit delta [Caldilineae bacterium]
MNEQRVKADRYARAILEAMVERWQETLSPVADALAQDAELLAAVNDPSRDLDERLAKLDGLLAKDAPAEIRNFLGLLAQEGDLELIPSVLAALRRDVSGQEEALEAEVVSAVELSDEDKERLRQRLTAEYGDGLVVTFRVDPSLLGGLRVRVGDHLVDNTVASRLTALRDVIASTVR